MAFEKTKQMLENKCVKVNSFFVDYFVTVDVCYVKEQETEIMGCKCAISDTFNFFY